MQFIPNRKFLLVAFILFAGIYQNAVAQFNIIGQNLSNNVNVVNAAAPFLLIGPDARAEGLGDAGAASSPDANSIYWNPAKLAFIKDTLGFSASYAPWLRQLIPNDNLVYVSGYYKLKGNQSIGGSFSLLTTSSQPSTLNGDEYSFDISYAKQISSHWSLGAACRLINSSFDVMNTLFYPQKDFGFDISSYYQGGEFNIAHAKANLAFGICISNIGPKMDYVQSAGNIFGDPHPEFLPTNLRVGPDLTIDLDDYNKLSFLFDLNKLLVPTPPIYQYLNGIIGANAQPIIAAGMNPNVNVPQGMLQSFYDAPGGFDEQFHEIDFAGGVEYSYANQFTIRSGFFYENPTKGGREYFTVGAGFKLSIIHLDAAYVIPVWPPSPLQNTLQITLGFYFR